MWTLEGATVLGPTVKLFSVTQLLDPSSPTSPLAAQARHTLESKEGAGKGLLQAHVSRPLWGGPELG